MDHCAAKVKIWKKFDVQLLIDFEHRWEPYSGPELKDSEKFEMQMRTQEKLRLLLMPATLCTDLTNDLHEDLGLERLFGGA
jgi:hypothetical protein